ncbi:MAG: RecX family transcriptional regulator [Clostridia bacterium]|nr:RecX family transcriptional regulator [Clostridia bacterium]
MYKIEAILRDNNSNEAVVIVGGNSYRITVHDLDTIGLEEGSLVDEKEIELLNEAVERLLCIKKAFDFLSYGDLSEKQLRDKLCRKFPRELSSDVARLFVERGYVNDARLAERYAETFYEFKNMGLQRIRNELFRRGISKDDIENAIAKYESEDQYERIEVFIRKKYDISKMNDIKYRQKVYSGALRAGFSGADIGDVLRNFESE